MVLIDGNRFILRDGTGADFNPFIVGPGAAGPGAAGPGAAGPGAVGPGACAFALGSLYIFR